MLILLLLLPRTTCPLKCVTGHSTDEHSLTDLKVAWCSSAHDTTCYTRRMRVWWGEDNYMYGCGHCHEHTEEEKHNMKHEETFNGTVKDCRECSANVCNTPHKYWSMAPYAVPSTLEPPSNGGFVPFRLRANFHIYESIAQPCIWAVPLAAVLLIVCAVIYMVLRANAVNCYYSCVRYWS